MSADLLGQPDARRLDRAGTFGRAQAFGFEMVFVDGLEQAASASRMADRRGNGNECCATGTCTLTRLTRTDEAEARANRVNEPQLTEVKATCGLL